MANPKIVRIFQKLYGTSKIVFFFEKQYFKKSVLRNVRKNEKNIHLKKWNFKNGSPFQKVFTFSKKKVHTFFFKTNSLPMFSKNRMKKKTRLLQ